VLLEILEVQKLERHAGPATLGVHVRPVGVGASVVAVHARIEARLERLLRHGVDLSPRQPSSAGLAGGIQHRSRADLGAGSHLPAAAPKGENLPQNLFGLPHGQSRRCHRIPPLRGPRLPNGRFASSLRAMVGTAARTAGIAARDQPEQLHALPESLRAMARNACAPSAGTAARDGPECLRAISPNTQSEDGHEVARPCAASAQAVVRRQAGA
jgi:hypothetical protein